MPPVAEKASRFRGNTPIGRRKASGNRQVRRCLRIASRQNDGCCGIFELPSPRGERDEAPPVAEEASRFRGSTPIGRRKASENRQVRRCLRIASCQRAATVGWRSSCRPREGKEAKRRRWRKKRAAFEEAPRLADAKRLRIGRCDGVCGLHPVRGRLPWAGDLVAVPARGKRRSAAGGGRSEPLSRKRPDWQTQSVCESAGATVSADCILMKSFSIA